MQSVLLRPGINLEEMAEVVPTLKSFMEENDAEAIRLAEVNLKYEGYIRKEQEMVDKMNRLESVKLREDLDYDTLSSLSKEARQKLNQLKPMTIWQASRISGVSPADISVLLVHVGR